MLRDDSGNGGGRPSAPRNVLGERLDVCSMKPKTGFFRDGCCNTNPEDAREPHGLRRHDCRVSGVFQILRQ